MRVLLVSADRTGGSGHPVNIGDAFLTDRLAAAVTARGHDVVVVDFGYARHGGGPRLQVGGTAALARLVRSSDLVLVGGGTLLQDDVERGWRGLPRLVAASSALAWAGRTRLVFFGVGCDPVRRPLARVLLRAAVHRRTVWVRDTESAAAFEQLTRRRPLLAADVCLLGPDDLGATDAPGAGAVLALAARDVPRLSPGHVQRLRSEHGSVTFLQMAQDSAGGAGDAARLRADTAAALDEITADLSWPQALQRVARAEVLVASRMHALYLGMLAGRPSSAVATAPKVRSFAREFGLPRYDDVDAAVEAGQTARAERAALDAARARVGEALGDALADPAG